MKLSFLKLFIFSVLALGAISCSNQQEEIVILQTSNNKSKSTEIEWNTNASMATIYALQYTNAIINPKFVIEPKSEQLPIFIDGEEALKYINIKEAPYSHEELEFIKEQLLKTESRAVLMRNVLYKDGVQIGNVIYVPYENGLKVPEKFMNQFGAFLNSFDMPDPPECSFKSTRIGMKNGKGCHCGYTLTCGEPVDDCVDCPENVDHFKNVLEKFNVDPEILTQPTLEYLKERIPISEISLGKSILDPNTFDF